jgi:hypothetical protein
MTDTDQQGIMPVQFCTTCGGRSGMHYGACRGDLAIDNTIASARLSGIEPTSEDRERMERLRSTIRERKALYEGLAAIPDADQRRTLYDAARKAIDTGDRRALAAYLSGLTPEELDRLGGFDDD